MARAADVWRIACPGCRSGRVLAGDGGGSIPQIGPFAVHDCFTCGLPAEAIAQAIAHHGLPAARDRSDHGVPLARAHYVEELARCERAFGPGHFAVARCHIALARSHDTFGEPEALQLDDPAAARAAYERELAIWRAAPDDAIAAYRAGHRRGGVPAHVASTTYALYPLHRDTDGDYREHQLLVAGARLATALDRLGADAIPARVFGELDLDRALRVGDFLAQTDKAFAAARWFYELAERLGAHDPLIHSIRAKLQMVRMFVEHEARPH